MTDNYKTLREEFTYTDLGVRVSENPIPEEKIRRISDLDKRLPFEDIEKKYSPNPNITASIDRWSENDVAKWVETVGEGNKWALNAKKFKEKQIDGPKLLQLINTKTLFGRSSNIKDARQNN